MHRFKPTTILALPLALLLQGCSHQGHRDQERPAPAPTQLSLRVACLASERYQAVQLFIEAVEIKGDHGWRLLAEPRALVDLGGNQGLLVPGVALPPEHYHALRLRLDPTRSRVTLAQGAEPLLLADPLKQGLVVSLNGNLRRKPGQRALVLTLDPDTAIQPLGPAQHALWPNVRVVDAGTCGKLSGRLQDSEQRPLAGVLVTAQEPSPRTGTGPVLLSKAFTQADGSYRLEGLPLDRTYHVVALPRAGTRLFAPQASPACRLTRERPQQTWDCTFQDQPEGQLLRFHLAGPMVADEPSGVELLKELPTGTFLIHSALAQPGPDGRAECQVEHLPLGRYQARATRLQVIAASNAVASPASQAKPCEVKAEPQPQVMEL